jgi:hypothetical protein
LTPAETLIKLLVLITCIFGTFYSALHHCEIVSFQSTGYYEVPSVGIDNVVNITVSDADLTVELVSITSETWNTVLFNICLRKSILWKVVMGGIANRKLCYCMLSE